MQSFQPVLIEIKASPIREVGVFASADLCKDRRVAEGIHDSDYERVFPWKYFGRLDRVIQLKVEAFFIGTPDGFIPPDDLDFNRLSIEWYFNHSWDGNLGFNEDGGFVARKNIRKGEELTYDYGLAESNPDFRMDCKCSSVNCRRIVTGNDWRDPGFRMVNLNYMLPRLRLPVGSAGFPPATERRAASSTGTGRRPRLSRTTHRG